MDTNEVNVNELTLNLGSYDTAMKRLDRQILEAGVYSLRMKSWKAIKGDNGVRVQFVMETFDCDNPEENEVALFHSTPISGKGEIFFLQTLKALGGVWEGENVQLAELLNSLDGTSAKAEVEKKPAQKKNGQGGYEPMLDDAGLQMFNNNIKRWVK